VAGIHFLSSLNPISSLLMLPLTPKFSVASCQFFSFRPFSDFLLLSRQQIFGRLLIYALVLILTTPSSPWLPPKPFKMRTFARSDDEP